MTVNSENSPKPQTIAAVQWFRAIMWLGIGANVACALISILWTEGVLNFLHLEMAHPLVWPRFAAFLWFCFRFSMFHRQSIPWLIAIRRWSPSFVALPALRFSQSWAVVTSSLGCLT